MKLKIKVMKCYKDERDFVNKDGSKRHAVISHVLGSFPCSVEKRDVILNLRSFDASWELPKEGAEWITPIIRRLESSDGCIYEGIA